jgi:hypothetical protein
MTHDRDEVNRPNSAFARSSRPRRAERRSEHSAPMDDTKSHDFIIDSVQEGLPHGRFGTLVYEFFRSCSVSSDFSPWEGRWIGW